MNASTLTLAHGSLLCNLSLDADQDLIIGADDLEDFYHSFVISAQHAQRNHIHGVFLQIFLTVGMLGIPRCVASW